MGARIVTGISRQTRRAAEPRTSASGGFHASILNRQECAQSPNGRAPGKKNRTTRKMAHGYESEYVKQLLLFLLGFFRLWFVDAAEDLLKQIAFALLVFRLHVGFRKNQRLLNGL
jgi:hypothetical protein